VAAGANDSGKKKNEYDVNGMRDIIEELVPQGIALPSSSASM